MVIRGSANTLGVRRDQVSAAARRGGWGVAVRILLYVGGRVAARGCLLRLFVIGGSIFTHGLRPEVFGQSAPEIL